MGEILVFYARSAQPLSDEIREQYHQQITFDSRFPSKRYLRWQDTQAHLMGRLLLLRGWESLGTDRPSIPALRYSGYHRPYFEDGPYFSIAHSGEYVLCAIASRGRVGVDVEQIRPIELAEMEPSFSASEWQAVLADGNPHHRLFDFWTKKEAVVKADGRGMTVADRVFLADHRARVDDKLWYLRTLSLADDHRACLASETTISEVKLTFVDFDV